MDGAESSSESEMEVDDQSEEEMNTKVYLLCLSEPVQNDLMSNPFSSLYRSVSFNIICCPC